MYQAKVTRYRKIEPTPDKFEINSKEWELHLDALNEGIKVIEPYETDAMVIDIRVMENINSEAKENELYFVCVFADGVVGVFDFTNVKLDYQELRRLYAKNNQ